MAHSTALASLRIERKAQDEKRKHTQVCRLAETSTNHHLPLAPPPPDIPPPKPPKPPPELPLPKPPLPPKNIGIKPIPPPGPEPEPGGLLDAK